MKVAENHHLLLTLFFGVMLSIIGLAALYMAVTQHNALALTTALPALVSGFLGLHAGSSVVATSPNTMAYGTPAPTFTPPPPLSEAPPASGSAAQPFVRPS